MNPSTINQKLRDTFGFTEGKPKFRVVNSNDMSEVRKGTFEKFSDSGNIFLGTETGFKRIQKYRWIKDRFIIEVLVPFTHPDVIPEINLASYEPAYVFEEVTGKPLPLDWDMTQLFCKCWLEVFMADRRYYQEAKAGQAKDRADREFDKEVEHIKDVIENEAPNLAYGSGVTVPSNYEKVE